jgi:MoaA/NifB/PqqE/SkfB family radical SAM enzyme
MKFVEFAADPDLPAFVQLEPVGQCNLRCRMCPVTLRDAGGPGKPPAFMSYETFCRLLEQFPAMKELHLQGLGEPLLHPRFFDMVAHAAARGITVTTNTNLSALSPRRAAECVASGLVRLFVSIDAADPAIYAYIRVGGRLERVLRNLRWIVEAKKRAGSSQPSIAIVAVAMRSNLEQMPALVRLAHHHGAELFSVQALAHDFTEAHLPQKYRPMREFVEAETLENEDPLRVEHWFEAAHAEARALGVQLRLPTLRNGERAAEPDKLRCDWPWRGAYIAYTGEAMPCCMVATPDRINFGSMANQAVVQVWTSAEYRRFRERLASAEPPEVCEGCAVYRGAF